MTNSIMDIMEASTLIEIASELFLSHQHRGSVFHSLLTVLQLCFLGWVVSGKSESQTLLRPTYSSSSPDAPLTPIAPSTSLSLFLSRIPPGKAAIFPPVMFIMLFIWQTLAISFPPVYLSLNSLDDWFITMHVYAFAYENSGMPTWLHPSIRFWTRMLAWWSTTFTATAANLLLRYRPTLTWSC